LPLPRCSGWLTRSAPAQAGRFARRHGYFTALKLGFSIMLVALAVGSQLGSAPGQIPPPSLLPSACASSGRRLKRSSAKAKPPKACRAPLACNNITWAVTMRQRISSAARSSRRSGFKKHLLSANRDCVAQLALTFWLQNHAAEQARLAVNKPPVAPPPPGPDRPSPAKAKAFLHMAWLANPFAYIAINTLIAVIPGIAARLHLSPLLADSSARSGALRARHISHVVVLDRLHYRFRWLVTAFGLLVVSFAAMLVVPSLAVLLAAQIFFGAAIGLIYYSSLFTRWTRAKSKANTAAFTRPAIGVGNFVGPAVGAASRNGCRNTPTAAPSP